MGLFEKLKAPDINSIYAEYLNSSNALLLDVRNVEEYEQGRIPGSVNVPLNNLGYIEELAPDHGTKIYVYCLSGMRSRKAQALLNRMGYNDVINMGGFSSFSGEKEM